MNKILCSTKGEPDPETEEPKKSDIEPKHIKKRPPASLIRKEKGTDFENPRLRDVIVNESVTNELEQIINGIVHRDVFEVMGTKPGQIYVFSGPPGTGKTMAAKAIRNEIYAMTQRVWWEEYNIGDHGTAYINMGAKNLRKLYDNVIAQVTQDDRIGIVFHDEIDVLLGARGNIHASKEDDKITNEAMKIWQELQDSFPNVYVFGATNYPEAIDKAAMRSGRVDKHVKFSLPCYEERKKGFILYANKVNEASMYKPFVDLDYDMLARESDGCNFADISQCIKNAVNTRANDFINESEGLQKITRPPFMNTQYVLDSLEKIMSGKERKNKMGFV